MPPSCSSTYAERPVSHRHPYDSLLGLLGQQRYHPWQQAPPSSVPPVRRIGDHRSQQRQDDDRRFERTPRVSEILEEALTIGSLPQPCNDDPSTNAEQENDNDEQPQ